MISTFRSSHIVFCVADITDNWVNVVNHKTEVTSVVFTERSRYDILIKQYETE